MLYNEIAIYFLTHTLTLILTFSRRQENDYPQLKNRLIQGRSFSMKLFKVHLTLIIYYFTGIAVKKSPPLSVRKDFSKDAAAVRPAIFTIE